MLHKVFISTVLFALLIGASMAYKTGAKANACEMLSPKHKNWTSQTDPSPYKVEAVKTGADTAEVTISGDEFKGILFVARSSSGSKENLGDWQPSENANLLSCKDSSRKDAITHQINSVKKSITLKWKAPAGFKGSVCFKGAIAKTGKVFWTEQKSNLIQF